MTITKFLLLLILLDLSVCTGCKDKDKVWTTLPPETQTGANTLGCMIDNELFVGDNNASWLSPPPFRVGYDKDSDNIYIDVRGLIKGNQAGYISMTINHPAQNSAQEIDIIGYYPSTNISSCRAYLPTSVGEIFISKFDMINKIVSGRFQFTGYCIDGDSTNVKQVTQGRFDLKFDIINNIDE